ncbi:hypothetical protein GIB67_029923 [Kingdonia uniflora]|uniref:Uncharacterized protein n=1 Tax=Kingdonia uniflora TaxID=39325 RepID=A0A7J7MXL6_9MAGN|nr:hypothetical protein GIB67_029923 [Kingdonia uniflora]
MDELGSDSERSRTWNVYGSSNTDVNSSQTNGESPAAKNYGDSMSAISFGFVATAVLISIFLIMALFEHLLRRKPPFISFQDPTEESLEIAGRRSDSKDRNSNSVTALYPLDISVLMPGQPYPTFIAQLAPLPSCSRERIYWPSHDHNLVSP